MSDLSDKLHLCVKALDGIEALAEFLEERLAGHEDGGPAAAGIAVLAGDANQRLRAVADALELACQEGARA